MKPLDPTGLKRLHREWRHKTTGRVALILDSVQSPFNVGSILRSAAAYRVEHVWLAGATTSPRAANVRKTALGTDRFLEFSTVDRAVDAVVAAQQAGWRVIALELTDDATPLHAVVFGEAVCIVVGNEDHGVSAAALRACDAIAYLPQLGKVGSLNVATAASIALYETRRQEWDP
ncbi:MAG TPA: TrmH family RNA methyltransferase [Acidimicrobiales bacterium]|nr:TrmH family RNA methyltransferase [Acidimicrobiales bacterium]